MDPIQFLVYRPGIKMEKEFTAEKVATTCDVDS